MYKETLSKDLTKIGEVSAAARPTALRVGMVGLAVLFLVIVWVFTNLVSGDGANSSMIVAAGVIGGYMALNIGANDVANNMAPAVGSRALTLAGALVIAAIFEAAGAILAGGDVVSTISKNIISADAMPDSRTFIWAMMSALLAAAIWVNLATYLNAPVSTTHSVVGGVAGAGIAAAGFGVVNWPTMGSIAASWVISPLMGGVIAAIFLAFVKSQIIYQPDKIAAARRWVPLLVALMAGIFSAYLIMKGLQKIWKPDVWIVAVIAFGIFGGSFAILKPMIRRQSEGMENRNRSLRKLFTIPLICSAALLSFAHGANDVANAVGPLAAIVNAATSGAVSSKVELPFWILLVGAAGISAGLVLFGPKLIRTVGEQITKMNPMRAYCVALSAAITVLIASALGLPVSSTHIAVGAVFGVGFYREYRTSRQTHINHGRHKKNTSAKPIDVAERVRRRKLVRRHHVMTIASAWVITVPAAALMAAAVFHAFNLFLS
ncbi:MAG: inorganic phosphate transporter [Proteobacteria bacterium]|nr:inorganic phosphate transporter [Pseudomonadota bacterium]